MSSGAKEAKLDVAELKMLRLSSGMIGSGMNQSEQQIMVDALEIDEEKQIEMFVLMLEKGC